MSTTGDRWRRRLSAGLIIAAGVGFFAALALLIPMPP